MGRPKKPDPPTQTLKVTLDSAALHLLNSVSEYKHKDALSTQYERDEISSEEFQSRFSYRRLTKAEQRSIRNEALSKIIREHFRRTYSEDGYELAMKRYREQQAAAREHWELDKG